MSRRWALALVAAVSLASHLKGIAAPPLDYHFHRQVNTAAIARNYSENGLHFLAPQIDWAGPYRGPAATEFPLYMWLMGLLWPMLGLAETWGRLLSAAFSAAAAIYLFLFLERRFSRAEALASAVLFSLIPLEIYFGRTIQPESLALCATLAAFYHWDRFLDEENLLHWACAALGAFLAIAHKLPYVYCLLTLAALSYLRRGAAAFGQPAVLAAAPLCLAAVFAWYRHAGDSGIYVVPTHAGEFASLFNYAKLPFYVQFQFLSRLPELGATWPGMALAAAGAWRLRARSERFLFVWWVSVAVSIVAGGGYTFHHEYTSLPFAPVMASFMGPGLVWGWTRAAESSKPWRARAALAALVALMPVTAAFRIKHWYRQNFPFLAQAAAAAAAVSAHDDVFVCNQRAPSVYLFHMRRRGWCWDLGEAGPDSLALVRTRAEEGARFFFTAKENFPPSLRSWFDARYPLVYDQGELLVYSLKAPTADRLAMSAPADRRQRASRR